MKLLHKIRGIRSIQEYDCENISLALTLPINIQTRQLSMWFALLEKFGENDISLVRMPDAPVKEIIKLIIIPKICKELGKSFEAGGLLINIALDHSTNLQELKQLKSLHAKAFPPESGKRKSGASNDISRGIMEKHYTPKNIKARLFQEYLPIPPPVTMGILAIGEINTIGPTVFIAGRYRKLSRKLSHTPWILKGQRIMEESIEEIIIASIGPHFRYYIFEIPLLTNSKYIFALILRCNDSRVTFMSSGREDVDVRCLGRGRPFILEIFNAKRTNLSIAKARQMELSIEDSGKLSVTNLQVVHRDETLHIRTGAEQKRKFYRALCVLKEPATKEMLEKLNLHDTLEIRQMTPLRVLHRRPLLSRARLVYNLKARVCRSNLKLLVLDIITQAGTYIKELVHGEFGRTRPSISELIGQPVDIMALDVMAIELDWPKDIDNRQNIIQ